MRLDFIVEDRTFMMENSCTSILAFNCSRSMRVKYYTHMNIEIHHVKIVSLQRQIEKTFIFIE
jgi:hypothetical protein